MRLPRDGWQNLKQMLTFDQKMDLIDRMFDAGVTQMEVTSFVSPKAIPQMADAADVAKACIEKHPDATLYALVPNFRGVENAFNAGIRNVSYVISVSESHNKANIRRTHEESLAELQKIMDTYPQMNICVALATVFGCPFEGIPPIQKPVDFAKRVYDMGIRSICLADTIGIADPHQVRETIQAMVETMPDCEFQIHIHDTRGMGAWPTRSLPLSAALPPCSPRSAASAAARLHRALPATPPRRISCTCSSAWAMTRVLTLKAAGCRQVSEELCRRYLQRPSAEHQHQDAALLLRRTAVHHLKEN